MTWYVDLLNNGNYLRFHSCKLIIIWIGGLAFVFYEVLNAKHRRNRGEHTCSVSETVELAQIVRCTRVGKT